MEQKRKLYETLAEIKMQVKTEIENEADNYIKEHKEQYFSGDTEIVNFINQQIEEIRKDTKKQLKKLDEAIEFLSMFLAY